MTVLNPDLEKNKNVIRYFLQQIANTNIQAVCVIEAPESKWCCGTKNMLSRLVSRDGVKASVKDAHEEILPEAPEAEKLEDDQDVFEENDLDSIKNLDTRWKFIGDCAFLIPENEDVENTKFNNVEAPAQIDQRKRKRNEETSKKDSPKLSRTESLTNDLKSALFGNIEFKVNELDVESPSFSKKNSKIIKEEPDSVKPFVCNICSNAYHTKEELKAHACTHTQPKPYQCDICHKGFSTKSNMQRHRNIHTKEKVFQCPHCSKKFYDSGNLKRHVEGVHSSKDANDFSEKLLDSSPSLLSPILKSENSLLSLLPQPSPPKSEKSDLSEGEIKSALLAAIRSGSKSPDSDPDQPPIIHNIDSEGQTYTCDRCLLRFTSKSEASDHLKCAHKGNENQHCLRVEQPDEKNNDRPFTYKLFYCDFCWKEFTWRANLVRHINIHTHEKIFPCSMCNKTFSSHTSLRRHEQKHQGVNYKCSKCLREFNDPSNLRRHEAACSGEKSDEPLTTQLSDIIEDQKPPKEKTEKKKDTEEQIKPHSCGYCHKSFGRAERLEEHLRTHTGETPYKCDICSKGFTTKHNLLRHRNIHTLERKYTCKYCHKFFADPTQHKRHQATHFAKQNKAKAAREEESPISLVIPKFGQPSNYSNIFDKAVLDKN